MRMKKLWKSSFVMLLAGWILIVVTPQFVHASSQHFSGDYSTNDDDGMYVDIPFSLQDDSAVFLEYHSNCTSQENSYFYLFPPWSKQATFAKATDIDQPYGPIPLVRGEYYVRLRCLGEKVDQKVGVEYSLIVSSTPMSTTFSQDQEPDGDEETAINVNGIQPIDGWLGVGGYTELQEDIWTDSGIDYSDVYYLTMNKDTKLQFKLEYDDNFKNNPFFGGSNGDIQLMIFYVKDGQTYFVHNFDIWTNSGDISEQITIKEGGLFKIYIRGGYSSSLQKGNYGGYRLTIMSEMF